MKGSTTYLNWFRRLLILGAVIGVGVFASTAGAVGRPPDVQDVAASIQASNVSRPPDVADVASRLSVGTPDVFERYAAAHPYGAGLSLSNTVVSRPPDVQDVASQLSTSATNVLERHFRHEDTLYAAQDGIGLQAPDVFERYAAAHPYGRGLSLNLTTQATRPPDVQDTANAIKEQSSTSSIVSRPPDVQDTAQALQQSSTTVGQSQGFDWNDWGIGIGTGMGLALLLGIGFMIGRQHRHRVQPA